MPIPNPFEDIFTELEQIRSLITEKQKQQAIQAEPEYGDIHFAARITTFATTSIYGMVSKNQIPHIKISLSENESGRGKTKLVFKKHDLYEWMDQFKVKTEAEEVQETLRNLKKIQQ